MSQPSPVLFSPLQLRGLTLHNRIMVSPMCQYSSVDGCAGDWHLMHLGQFAVSGVGLLMVEMTNVEARGRITPGCMGLYSDANEQALSRVVQFCRQYGNVPVGVQLAHAGRKASVQPPWHGRKPLYAQQGGWQPVAPSPIPSSVDGLVPHELTRAEIEQLIVAFANAARRAARIHLDAIELHAAHGYLLHQFLSPLSNQRSDEYGGSLNNRMRLPLQVFDAVRAVWPDEKPLGVRVSATDWADGGWDIDDTVAFARSLKQRDCDWVDVSSGGLVKNQILSTGPGYQVPFAERVRNETGIITVAVGMITEPQQAETIVARGQADIVALARAMLYDPHWTWHAADVLGVRDVKYPNQYLRARPWVRNDIFAEREAAR